MQFHAGCGTFQQRQQTCKIIECDLVGKSGLGGLARFLQIFALLGDVCGVSVVERQQVEMPVRTQVFDELSQLLMQTRPCSSIKAGVSHLARDDVLEQIHQLRLGRFERRQVKLGQIGQVGFDTFHLAQRRVITVQPGETKQAPNDAGGFDGDILGFGQTVHAAQDQRMQAGWQLKRLESRRVIGVNAPIT